MGIDLGTTNSVLAVSGVVESTQLPFSLRQACQLHDFSDVAGMYRKANSRHDNLRLHEHTAFSCGCWRCREHRCWSCCEEVIFLINAFYFVISDSKDSPYISSLNMQVDGHSAILHLLLCEALHRPATEGHAEPGHFGECLHADVASPEYHYRLYIGPFGMPMLVCCVWQGP